MRAAAKGDRRAIGVSWLEEGEASDVVPVRMGEEEANLYLAGFLSQELAQIAYSRPGINNDNLSVVRSDLDACGVAAIAERGRPRR